MTSLQREHADILAGQAMGHRGTVPTTFAAPVPPRTVVYWGQTRRVQQYQPRVLVCRRCHMPGHKNITCPAQHSIYSGCGNASHTQEGEECPHSLTTEKQYCKQCKAIGNLAVDPTCPKNNWTTRSENKCTSKNARGAAVVAFRSHSNRWIYQRDATRWKKRVHALAHKNDVPLPVLNNIKETSPSGKQLRERVVAAETRRWAEKVVAKPSLRRYASHKHTISQEHFYADLPGSAMLFEARAGVLRTRMGRRKWDDAEEVMCAVCGEEEETAEHIVLSCEQQNPNQPSDTTLAEVLLRIPRQGAHWARTTPRVRVEPQRGG
ncbi:hypothetical protein HPB48_007190 [Haemaphysalis longicornis]|uniref:Uncharacterized protein n=1 Tax=Haemaphysalis longicornis TaxID=44386 RepID=A0A9J6G4N9_HAELO|nr:hypothetical protein HPB48_007190 [Haemaphysalis longicornis]